MKLRYLIGAVTLLLLIALAFNQSSFAVVNQKPLKVAFLTVGPVSDFGWNWAHDQGRIYLESKLRGQIETTLAERVPESAEVERVMEKMIAQGAKLIYATSYGYLEPALRVAARHPDVTIMHCGRPNPQPMKNVGSYAPSFVKEFAPMYVAGTIVGKMTKKNAIGVVAAHPVPPILLSLNAFTLGARSVNPKVKVNVVWTNSWSDAPTEAEAAKGLIDRGADVLLSQVDSPITVVQTAEKNNVYVVATQADVHHLAPKEWLTGEHWEWGPLYVQITQSVLNHTWKPGNDSYGEKYHFGKLSTFGASVPKSLQQQATDLLHQFSEKKVSVFKGPMKDRDGKERIAAGRVASDEDLAKINWFVPGIEGSVSTK